MQRGLYTGRIKASGEEIIRKQVSRRRWTWKLELELEMTIIDIEIGHKTRKKSSPLIRMKHIQNRSSMNMIRITFCKTRHFFFANSFITRLLWKEEQFFAENILYSGAIYFVFGNGRLIKSVNCRGMEWNRIYFLLRDCELFNTKRWG